MGYRANSCVRKNWAHFAEWTEPELTKDELEWLNSRTLLEAGFSHGSNIDERYHYHFPSVMTGRVIEAPCLPAEDATDLQDDAI
jgi:hypothetical protein